jgi:hypothetical protein
MSAIGGLTGGSRLGRRNSVRFLLRGKISPMRLGEVRCQKEGNAAKRGSDRFSLPLTISSDYPMVEMVNPPVHHLLYCNK